MTRPNRIRFVADRVEDLVLAAALVTAGVVLLRVPGSAPGDRAGAVLDPPALDATPTPAVPGPDSAEAHGASTRLLPDVVGITDAAPSGSGWILLDGRSRRVVRLNGVGEPRAGFGRPGEGPGELDAPSAVTTLGDTVVVAERGGGRLHLFTRDGRFVERRALRVPGCAVPLVLDAAGLDEGSLAALVRCPGEDDAVFRDVIVRVSGGAPDRVLLDLSPDGSRGVRPFLPLLAAQGRLLALGRQDDRCLFLVAVRGPIVADAGRRCFPRRSSAALDDPTREEIADRFEVLRRRSGIRVEVPDRGPVLLSVSLLDDTLHAVVPGPEEGLALLTLGPDGALDRRALWATGGAYVSSTSILEYREELNGIRIRITPRRVR